MLFAFVGIANAQIVYDFEDGTIPSAFTNDDSHPWTVVSVISSTGNYCLQSGNGGISNSSSTISLTQAFASDGYIQFDANCMGESTGTIHWDKCEFSVDGEVQFTHGSDSPGWFTFAYNVAAGTHVFSWSYTKDASMDPEGDYFQVDNIIFNLGTACVAPSEVNVYVAASKAFVEWNGISESFTLRYRKDFDSWITLHDINGNSYNLENLTTGNYTVEVQADCVLGTWAYASFYIYAPVSYADWFGFAESSYDPVFKNKFFQFKMQDVSSLTEASEEFDHPVYGSVFVKGYVWFCMYNDDASDWSLYKAPIDIYTKTIGTPEVVTTPLKSANLAYNPANGLIYYLNYDDNHIKSFNPEAIGPVTDYGTLPAVFSDIYFAINQYGEAYLKVRNNDNGLVELYTLDFNTLSMTLVGELEDFFTGMAFDFQTNELFGFYNWDMFHIDLASAQMSYIGSLGVDNLWSTTSGLFMVYDWDAVGESPVESLNVYPNPTQGQITVEGTGLMVVVNLLGQEVLSQQIDGKATIELPKGIYLVRVNNAMSKVVVE